MHVHILGICGTFMGSLAILAKELGHRVTGSDENVYPPMSAQLEAAGIELFQGYDAAQLSSKPDQIIVGNVMTRGHDVIEYMLQNQFPLVSGPQWLRENLLSSRWVLAVAGTHGKTTTSSMLAWILEYAGLNPGFLIGGVPHNFGISARLGDSPFFVIEADEYDTAFFDKRSKFIHYMPRTLVINNIEFDHADIFRDLQDVQRQFHHLMKLMPKQSKLIFNADDENIKHLIKQGCWSENESFGMHNHSDWSLDQVQNDKQPLRFSLRDEQDFTCALTQFGEHNAMNAIAAIVAARHAGVAIPVAIEALEKFQGVKRRLENRGTHAGVTVYDDFAHHPTEIRATLQAFKNQFMQQRLIVVFEPRSNTMQLGVHNQHLAEAFSAASELFIYDNGGLNWSLAEIFSNVTCSIDGDIDRLVGAVMTTIRDGDNVIILSNGGFGGFCEKLIASLQAR
jgi:UDP-N-acetylmuramate: L-alanyl-gamma-D-glutamyl-meso-diaminopimelate ligase